MKDTTRMNVSNSPRTTYGVFLAILFIVLVPSPSRGFQSRRNNLLFRQSQTLTVRRHENKLYAIEQQQSTKYVPVFDFTNPTTVNKFERIDDAIMGGISLSSMKQSEKENFARWSGICRIDGGGFCGTRTLPFEKPIEVGRQAEGIYLDYRFTSDDEPDRRVWKITTRSEQSRGEQLYQAMFNLSVAPTTNDNDVEEEEWTRTEIPFRTFQQVRGPRLIEGAPKLDVTNGLYQIGLSLSKFMISKNVTEIPNFRPGYFELQIKEIGIYTRQEKEEEEDVKIPVPTTLSKSEIAKRRPLLLKILLPIAKLFFSEKRRRRDSAIRILRQRGLTRSQAIFFGFKIRAKRIGFFPAMARSMLTICEEICRASLYWTLRLVLVIPIRFMLGMVRFVSGKMKSSGEKAS